LRIKNEGNPEMAEALSKASDPNELRAGLINKLCGLKIDAQKVEAEIRDFKAFLDSEHTEDERRIAGKHLARLTHDYNKGGKLIERIIKELENIK
jgi:hypothetical protein